MKIVTYYFDLLDFFWNCTSVHNITVSAVLEMS